MSYTALYRKFRPLSFEEVKGQDHIVKTLKNQIKGDRIGHAYLFCGTRGTGKTSVAKIFAKAVNCENPTDGSPCGKCKSCLSIADGTNLNVVEMDAASNSHVEDIRGIIQEVEYPPTDNRYRVYIIDEVHALSGAAFQALLKTLEEPPSYVIFILATTEIHKVPQTIKSRCQRYDFHRISIDTITERLNELMAAEGTAAEDKGLRYIAKAADGSMRDALSLLEQCVGFYSEGTLTYDNVLEILGAVDTEEFERLLFSVTEGDVARAIKVVDDAVNQGRDLTQFVLDFAWYLRNLLLIRTGGNFEDILDISTENLASMKETAESLVPQLLTRYIEIFSALADDMKYSGQRRTLLEIAVIKLCRPQMGVDYNAMLHRIVLLENTVKEGAISIAPTSGAIGQSAAGYAATESKSNTGGAPVTPARELPAAVPDEIKKLLSEWNNVIERWRGPRGFFRQAVQCAHVTMDEDCTIVLMYGHDRDAEYYTADDEEKLELLRKYLSETAGCEVGLRVEFNDSDRPNQEVAQDALAHFRSLGIPIETE